MRRSQKTHDNGQLCESTDVPNIPLAKVRLENGWNSKQMITEGESWTRLGAPNVIKRNQNKDQL